MRHRNCGLSHCFWKSFPFLRILYVSTCFYTCCAKVMKMQITCKVYQGCIFLLWLAVKWHWSNAAAPRPFLPYQTHLLSNHHVVFKGKQSLWAICWVTRSAIINSPLSLQSLLHCVIMATPPGLNSHPQSFNKIWIIVRVELYFRISTTFCYCCGLSRPEPGISCPASLFWSTLNQNSAALSARPVELS